MINTAEKSVLFSHLGLSPLLLEILQKRHLSSPTPIQTKAIPVAMQGKDLIGIAQTGTGKTFAFAFPVLEKIQKQKGMALILLPTRELALQVETEIMKFAPQMHIKTVLLMGGASIHGQIQRLKQHPQIIIATPGRLNDHLNQRTVSLSGVHTVVLDEADRMLDMGFEPQIKRILQQVPGAHQTLLFSATMPPKIQAMAKQYMKNPIRVEASPAGSVTQKITQEGYFVSKEQKVRLLQRILLEQVGSILVFIKTKHAARKLTSRLKGLGHLVTEIHGNRSTGQRKESLQGFRTGKFKVLIATDIASRGIDVPNIMLVINYDLPQQDEDYIHRIGRTGRAGKTGKAITFFTAQEKRDLRRLEMLSKAKIEMRILPELPVLPEMPKVEIFAHKPHKGRKFGKPSSGFGHKKSQGFRKKRFHGR